MGHFSLSYVLPYAGLLEQSARECDTALALVRSNYQIRSCSGVFVQLGKPDRAMDFVRLDAGSEYPAMQTAAILLGQDKPTDPPHPIHKPPHPPPPTPTFLQPCLSPTHLSQSP